MTDFVRGCIVGSGMTVLIACVIGLILVIRYMQD